MVCFYRYSLGTLFSCCCCRWPNLQVHSTRSYAWASSSRTHRTNWKSSRRTLKVDHRFRFRLTSSAITASPPLNFSCKLPRTPPTAVSWWTASRFAATCIGWKAVANSPSSVPTFFFCFVNLIGTCEFGVLNVAVVCRVIRGLFIW